MKRRTDAGFSLIDVMVVVALISIVAGMAVPALKDVSESLKLGTAGREVERELQTARLKAVTSNRPIRVRFNCPVAGQYRMVELIGTTATPDVRDTAVNRCQESVYPNVPADREPLTRPNHDGPVRQLPDKIAFGAAETLEFWPDGSVHKQEGVTQPWPVVSTTEITLVKGLDVKKITVNGLGKVTLVP